MGAVLSVQNDRLHDFEILQANIFTTSQGICLQRLIPEKSVTFRFDHTLAYGSWYDVQIIGRFQHNGDNELIRYLKKGIYLSRTKTITMIELTDEKYRDHGAEWVCGNCRKANFGSVAICQYCYTNKSQTIINIFSLLPIIGIPFSTADAILRCGKASQSNTTADKIDAGITTIFAVFDVITAPFIIVSLVQIPAKVAAENGIKLTTKSFLFEAGKPLLKEFGKELGKDGIMSGLKITKGALATAIRKIE